MSSKPLCFVLMPFGSKPDDRSGKQIDFDRIYRQGIRPGIEAAGMEPIRADEERTGGIIHKPMFERLMLCDYAVADLTTANANVFYELGVRHAVRPATTLCLFAEGQSIPFDVHFVRAMPYSIEDAFSDEEAAEMKQALTLRLLDLKRLQTEDAVVDSPVFQLLDGYAAPAIDRLKTDVFRQKAEYANLMKHRLADVRSTRDQDALQSIRFGLGDLADVEAGILVDLFLSYRALELWQEMTALYKVMPAALKRVVMVREQLGFALNRLGRKNEATRVLETLLDERGDSSETCGLMGRIFKDQWQAAVEAGQVYEAEGFLEEAIKMYLRGFEADIRDAYPGINAVTLMEIQGEPETLEHQQKVLPVVRYALERRLQGKDADYWDYATQLELAVLANDSRAAQKAIGKALAHVREPWEIKTTGNNLKLIYQAREKRMNDVAWIHTLIEALSRDD